MINLNSSAFSKSNIKLLIGLYLCIIVFFYYIGFEHGLNDFINAILIATKIFLIPSIIGTYLLKWLLEIIFTLSNKKIN